jgi:ribosomal protein L7/L12
VAEARAAKAARPQAEARIKGLVDGMPATLRAEVQKQLQAGRKIEAIKHYREATGADLATAKSVVDRMGN